MSQQVLKKLLTAFHVVDLGVAVEQKAPLVEVACQTAPVRGLAAQAGEIRLALHPLALPLADGSHLLQAQALGLAAAAPKQKQQHARHRQGQQQTHPRQLIGGAAGPVVDPDGNDGAHKDQTAVDEAGFLPEEIGQQCAGNDLGQDGQRAEQDAGGRGDPPLPPFCCIRGCHEWSSPFQSK